LAAWTAALLTPLPEGKDWTSLEITLKFLFSKFLHLSAYAVLAVLTAWVRVPARYRWLLILVLAAHATATEFIQQFVPGRSGKVADIGLDLIGIFLGCLLSWKWWCEPS
jgi:VanZ family protein